MKAVVMMFDTLCRQFISCYNEKAIPTPNFDRLNENCIKFEKFYAGSMPCMPARREMHTGRYNFLHRSWGPLEPFDFSCVQELQNQGVYTHIVSDHSHYWEDGGATYLTRFNSWEGFRGQEGDRWMPIIDKEKLNIPKHHPDNKKGVSFYHNWANRQQVKQEEDFSIAKTITAGIDFIEQFKDNDNWFLQIETFDPHEPFNVPAKYLKMVEDNYQGDYFDWPTYSVVKQTPLEIEHIRKCYNALVLMCDEYLGKVLDAFDKNDLWKDTLLIVNTDHGFLLNEHAWWGKNIQPFYEEIIHTPFFMHVPNSDNKRSYEHLAQTIDIAPTLLDFFNIENTQKMDGYSLLEMLKGNQQHESILFGSFGSHVNICDGEYVYMRSSLEFSNKPLYEYTLMPTAMRGFIKPNVLKKAELVSEITLSDLPVLKLPANGMFSPKLYGNKLFDLIKDPQQLSEVDNLELEFAMLLKLYAKLKNVDAPLEQYQRLGLFENMSIEQLKEQKDKDIKEQAIELPFTLNNKYRKQMVIFKNMFGDQLIQQISAKIVNYLQESDNVADDFFEACTDEILSDFIPKDYKGMLLGVINSLN